MALPAKKMRYTFADCLTWDENERMEIIGGEACRMAPPLTKYQAVRMEPARRLANFLEGRKCKGFPE